MLVTSSSPTQLQQHQLVFDTNQQHPHQYTSTYWWWPPHLCDIITSSILSFSLWLISSRSFISILISSLLSSFFSTPATPSLSHIVFMIVLVYKASDLWTYGSRHVSASFHVPLSVWDHQHVTAHDSTSEWCDFSATCYSTCETQQHLWTSILNVMSSLFRSIILSTSCVSNLHG